MTSHDWTVLGDPAPTALSEARLQSHWAVQLIAATADALIERRVDDGHTSMDWLRAVNGLVGHQTPFGVGVGVRFEPFELLLVDVAGDAVAQLPLDGKSLREARSWLGHALGERAARPIELVLRDYDMPDHSVFSGGRFGNLPEGSLAELGRWLDSGLEALRVQATADWRASAVRVWPHHFDAGAVLFLDAGAPPDKARQIGFGMSPGDASYAQPYFYVTPWPIPAGASLPPLAAGGHWHSQGFTGAVLTGEAVVAAPSATEQQDRVANFLRSAIEASRAVVSANH